MGDKLKEKLPTKMYGSTPPVFGAGDNPSAEDSEDYSTVRGGTLPPPAPPTTLSAPIMPKRPDVAPRPSRMADRIAQALAKEGDGQVAEAAIRSAVLPPLTEEEKEEVARLSGIVLGMPESLENTLEGPAEDPTEAIETATKSEEVKVAVREDDEPDSSVVSVSDMATRVSSTPPPISLSSFDEGEDEAVVPRARISVARQIRMAEVFEDNPGAEEVAPFILWIDNFGSLRCPLADGEVITVGRSPDCDLVIESSESVSAHHFMVKRDGEDCFIVDCNSLNGTYIGGDLRSVVAIDEWSDLFHGDRITIGKDVALFFSDANKPKRAPASSALLQKGGKMTENDMKAPTVELPPVLQGDTGVDTDGGEVNTSPEVVPEEPVAPDGSKDPSAEKTADTTATDDDKASRHVAPTLPLEMVLPEAKPATVPNNTAPPTTPPSDPTPPPLPKEKKNQKERETSLVVIMIAVFALLLFFIISFTLIMVNLEGNVPAESTTMVTDIEKAPVDGKPMPAKEAGTVQFTAVDILTRMEPLVEGALGWTPEDQNGPLADIVLGKRIPTSSGDCFPEISPAPPELDALRCCLVLGNAGDVEEIAKCVGMSTVTQLRLAGNLP